VPNAVTAGETFPAGVATLPSLAGWDPQALWTLAQEAARMERGAG